MDISQKHIQKPAFLDISLFLPGSASKSPAPFSSASALLYMLGMTYLEGQPRGFWRAFEWAGESLSTTGYGADSTWRHPLMIVYVVLVQFIGVFLVFLVIPIYLIPFLEERFETRLPKDAPKMSDHVIIFHHSATVATAVSYTHLTLPTNSRV